MPHHSAGISLPSSGAEIEPSTRSPTLPDAFGMAPHQTQWITRVSRRTGLFEVSLLSSSTSRNVLALTVPTERENSVRVVFSGGKRKEVNHASHKQRGSRAWLNRCDIRSDLEHDLGSRD